MDNRAIVFGASGVTGWSFVNELLRDYPEEGVWNRVVAMTNRTLNQEDSLWPADSRLQIVSGVNLLDSQEVIEGALREKVQDLEKITHVYYLAYKASTNLQQEFQDAVSMFQRSTTAMDRLSPALKFVVLQTGAKMYGCHLTTEHPTEYIHVPLSEDMPRLKQPYHDMLFYHPQLDWISEYARDKKWSWCETRPDIIIGFSIGIFLTLFATVEGHGVECPFPGTLKSWNAKSNDSSSDMIARQTIHLSLNLPAKQKGKGFNVADSKQPSTWSQKWPQLASYFGLKGTPPPTDPTQALEVRSYIKEHLSVWKPLEQVHSLKPDIADSSLVYPGFEHFLLSQFDFDRQYDMTKMYSTPAEKPFTEERGTMEAWGGVFDRMRAGRLIPKGAKAN
ncbi:hypothetical protein M409DRAFT_67017 [Zasmidium cellare ATCC 36951]|uniref:PRISE-like Rossmann-fold domain-containing protein n=1 Tax=Zasmidium cellare ATCC 36951 TaxID=1080233 RepID=A0A6A6CJM0_ZASCE|nr:uncharacterized protein M409DRAFT_67017 [Zasmidium cellare ATCC 36951]KAF2165616.1 hypothetical protein M409DRAFT_67017 [Zasmidium cellare ATCC 36951]